MVNEVTEQRKDGTVQEALLHSATTVCVCLRSVSPSSHRDNPQAFLWVYEGLAVACGRSKKRQTASRRGATVALEQHRFISKVIMSFPSQSPLGSDLWGKSSTEALELPQVSSKELVFSSLTRARSELGHVCAAQAFLTPERCPWCTYDVMLTDTVTCCGDQ